MKKRSKIPLCLLLLFTICLFAGCDPATFYFDNDELQKEVERIELINYDNDQPQRIEVDSSTILKFETENVQVKHVLEEEKVFGFINELSKITFHLVNESADSPTGRSIRMVLRSGNFIIISCNVVNEKGYSFVAEFSENGDFVKHIAHFAERTRFDNLIDDYFD